MAASFLAELAAPQPGDPGWFQFALEEKASGRFVGDCGLRILDAATSALRRSATPSPAPAGTGALPRKPWALSRPMPSRSFRLHRITASVDPRNIASCRVLEKTGFVKEAHFRKSEWFKGEWADDVIYARLKSDL